MNKFFQFFGFISVTQQFWMLKIPSCKSLTIPLRFPTIHFCYSAKRLGGVRWSHEFTESKSLERRHTSMLAFKNASFKYVKFANCTFISSQNFRAQNLHCWLGQCRENHNFIPIFDERSGSHISNHWLKCRRSCVEKCPLFM